MDAPFTAEAPAEKPKELSFRSPFVRRIHYGFERAIRIIEIVLAAAFIVAVSLDFFNAADRYLFNGSLIGADEVQMFIMIYVTFVGAAIVAWRRRHLRIDIIASYLPQRLRAASSIFEIVITGGLVGVLAYQSFLYVEQMAAVDRRSDLASIPMWIPHLAIAGGFLMIALISLAQLVELVAEAGDREGASA